MSGGVRVGFIGAGKMAGALAKGFAKTLPTGAQTISASCPPQDARLLDDMQYRMSTSKYCLFLYFKIPLHAVETKDGRDCYG